MIVNNCHYHRLIEWLQNHNLNIPDWPSRSLGLNLNPIENTWGLLEKNFTQQRTAFRSKDDLLTAINNNAWDTLPQD
jgi:hypothetical protein